jgi:hypothetical protein
MRFEERLPALEQSITNMPSLISQSIPEMSESDLRRMFRRIPVQLGRLDKKGAKQPQHLFYGGQYLPDYLLSLIDPSINAMANGAATFVQQNLSQWAQALSMLDLAVGADADEVKRFANTAAADLAAAVSRADAIIEQAQEEADAIAEIGSTTKAKQSTIAELVERISSDAARTSEARRTVDELLNPDGRAKLSLENAAKKARGIVDEISKFAVDTKNIVDTVAGDKKQLAQIVSDSNEALKGLKSKEIEAEQILNLASKAGLAASYIKETSRLESRSTIFTVVLYVTAIFTILAAAFWVLPEIEKGISKIDNSLTLWQVLSLTLLRATALAPLVYVLYFTNKRISEIELLRMDYAEKAAASLAYSGYEDQMKSDANLLYQLKTGLLRKFSQNPERLLQKSTWKTSARIKNGDLEVNANHEERILEKSAQANDDKSN